MAQLFAPSSHLLSIMIASAEAKFAADRDQALARKEAEDLARAERAWVAEAKAKSFARRWW